MYRAKNHNSELRIRLTGNSEFSESSKFTVVFFEPYTHLYQWKTRTFGIDDYAKDGGPEVVVALVFGKLQS